MSLGQNKSAAQQIIEAALDGGINHLDTADLYDFGLNEQLIGEIVKPYRNDIIITSKVGNHFNRETKDWYWDPSQKYILGAVKNSLKRLQTDYIDFYMLHGGTIDDPIDETIEAFEQLKKEGWIRSYGISSIRPNVIRQYVERSNIDGVMLQYSLFDRRAEEEILDLLHEKDISALSRGPLAKGMLSSQGEAQIDKKAVEGYLDYNQEELRAVYKELQHFTSDSLPMHALALKYVLYHPAIATAVFGASSLAQLQENTNFNHRQKLTEKVYHQVQQVTKNQFYSSHR